MSKFCIIYMNYSSFSYSQVHVGLASIFTYLQRNGHTVHIYDTFYDSSEQILEKCKAQEYDYIGFSTTELHSEHACKIAKAIHDQLNSPIVFGGPFPTIYPEYFLSTGYITYVCVGDGEYTLNELLNGTDPRTIRGLWYQDKGEIIQNGVSDSFDINEIDVTDYSCFARQSVVSERTIGRERVGLSFSWSSRGCAYSCAYCSNAELNRRLGYGIRFRAPQNLVNEINYLQTTYSCDGIFLSDENFLFNTSHYRAFAATYGSSYAKTPFGFLSRPEHINARNIDYLIQLKQVGWKWVSIGIEIGNEDKRCSILNRRNSNQEIIDAFYICKALGVHTNAFLIAGFFFEDYQDIAHTEQLLNQCQPDSIDCSIIYPLWGTNIYKQYQSLDHIHYKPPSISYFEYVIVKHPIFSNEEILAIRDYWENFPANRISRISRVRS